jgi:hypothetical protein
MFKEVIHYTPWYMHFILLFCKPIIVKDNFIDAYNISRETILVLKEFNGIIYVVDERVNIK